VGIVIGFLLLHSVTLIYYRHERMVDEAGMFAADTAERTLAIAAAARERPELLGVFSNPSFNLSFENVALDPPRRVWPHSEEIGAVIIERLRRLQFGDPESVRFWYSMDASGRSLVLQFPMDERWLVVHSRGHEKAGRSVAAAVWTTFFGGAILLAVLWTTRRFTRGLPRIAQAVERVGRGTELLPLSESGPREIRGLTRSFNAMQSRVNHLLAERNTMLGALSHDLRTLVTRLALRLESLEDQGLLNKVEEDTAAITSLLDEALAYARDEANLESEVRVELPSLIQALLGDRIDSGADAAYSGPESFVLTGGPMALRRLFGNLIDNAIRYGEAVRVGLEHEGAWVRVTIADPGPGIPEADQARAMCPFERLEPSRNRETGGSGLGLSIAQSIVERSGGSLAFRKTDDEFVVEVSLPLPHR
jgi:signal transduction histidine kinase